MQVWVICDHEPLPVDPGDRRTMRGGMLCQALAAAGHRTTWFTSTTDHYLKRRRRPAEDGIAVAPNLTVRILDVPTYRKNISLRRLLHNALFARAFLRVARGLEVPDVVVAALPTTDAAAVGVAFAAERHIPSVIDVRDIWPDTFRKIIPRPLLGLGAPILARLDGQARFACAGAASIVAVSGSYLHWAEQKGRRSGTAGLDHAFPIGHMARRVPGREARLALFERLGIAPGRRIVSFVGSWGRSHDLGLVLETARRLADQPDIAFVLAGDGESQPGVRARLMELANVVLPGWLSASEAAMLIDGSDIGLLPYRRGAAQSLPNKVFEYMSYGAYQIATLDGEVRELYERTGTGRSVEPTAEALAGAVRDHLARPHSRRERADRIATFEHNFTGAAVYRLMADHIACVAKDGAGEPN